MKMDYIKFILALTITVIFYKDGIHKMNNVYQYYLIVSDFGISKNKFLEKTLTSMLISFDLIISLGMLFNSTRTISCILGISLEIFYLIMMLKNYEKGFEHGCNCYVINTSMEVKLMDILKIMGIVFVFSFILIV